MDGLDKLTAVGSGVLAAAMTFLFVVGLVTILAGGSSESLIRDIPGAGPLVGRDNDSVEEIPRGDERPPAEQAQAVAAAEETPAPSGQAGDASPTPTPDPAVSEFPAAQFGVRTLNESPSTPSTPTPAGAPVPLPTRTPRPSPAPAPPPGVTPAPEPTPRPTPEPTPPPPPVETCIQAESGIVTDHKRILIERGSVVSFGVGVLVLATAEGPVTLEITVDTVVTGDLSLATQVRAEAHVTGNGRVIARTVDVLC